MTIGTHPEPQEASLAESHARIFKSLEVSQHEGSRRPQWLRRRILSVCLSVYVLAALMPDLNEIVDMGMDPARSYPERWAPSTPTHLLGTDNNRKDVLVRLVYGARTSLMMGAIATSVYVVSGILLGVVAGYVSGWPRQVVQGLFRVVGMFPILLLLLLSVIFIDAVFSGQAGNFGIAILMVLFGFFSSPKLAEVVRGRILSLKDRTFIEAASALGLSHRTIIWRHIILSECKPIVFVQGAYMMGQAVLVETTLTYLKFGVEFPLVSWGMMLREMQDGVIRSGLALRRVFEDSVGWLFGDTKSHVLDRSLDGFGQEVLIQPLYPILCIALMVAVFLELARYLGSRVDVED